MAYQGHDRSFEDLFSQTKATAKSLTVAELKNVLRQEGLQVSGIKSELQIRIIARESPPVFSAALPPAALLTQFAFRNPKGAQ